MSTNPPTVPPYPPYPPVPPSAPQKKGFWSGMGTTQKIIAIVAGSVILACVVCASCVGVLGALNPSKTSASATQTSGGNPAVMTKVPAGPTATRGPTATATPSYAHFGDGTFQVGKDIQPGTYRTRQGSGGCYYERLNSLDGSLSSVIANNYTSSPAIVTIAKSDVAFQSKDCGTWTTNLSQITASKTSLKDGMYIVGVDITPGTYKSDAEVSGCYWERLRDFGGGISGIIANGNPEGQAIVTIRSTDKGFSANGCGTWNKI